MEVEEWEVPTGPPGEHGETSREAPPRSQVEEGRLGGVLGGLGGVLGVSWAVLGGLGAVLGGHGSPKVVLGSTGSCKRVAKIALELRLPMFQSFLKVRKKE